MKSNEGVQINIFGIERDVEIWLVGDNRPEYNMELNQLEVVGLTEKEEELLNWIKDVDFRLFKDKIIGYINYFKDLLGEDTHDDYDLSDGSVFLPTSIIINVKKDMDDETAEIALFGESEYLEDGIMIAFKNGKYFGICGFDDCMNNFEEFEDE